jgi:hypothetical protein
MPSLQPLRQTACGEYTLAEYLGELVLIRHRRQGANPLGDFKLSHTAAVMLCEHFRDHDIAFRYLDAVVFPEDHNVFPRTGLDLQHAVLGRVTLCDFRGEPDLERLPNTVQDLSPRAILANLERVDRHDGYNRAFAENLLAAALDVLRPVAGRIQHPVHGEPKGVWLRPTPAARVEGPTVVDLVDRFNLDPASRDAFGTYLCGLFHAVSLESPRPILLVDSWVRGLGKSCLCACVARLLDGSPTSVNLDGRHADERLTAHLATGRRALVGGNLDSKMDFHPIVLTHLSTDGGHSDRVKYGKTTTKFDGIAPMINVVYGAASLHVDIIRRALRVELQGRSIVKGEGTTDLWCRDNRGSIISSILEAHEAAAEANTQDLVLPKDCRFEDFLRVGAVAWGAASSRSPWSPRTPTSRTPSARSTATPPRTSTAVTRSSTGRPRTPARSSTSRAPARSATSTTAPTGGRYDP